jgi:hypothetical protein
MRFVTRPGIVLALLFSALPAFAADITGAWTLTVETPNGSRQSAVDFKQDGKNLSGTMHSQMGDAPLTGTVDGDQVSFSITRERDSQSFKIEYSAKVEGSKMTGSLKFGDNGDIPFTAAKK